MFKSALNENKEIYVTEGRWFAIPTGPWSDINSSYHSWTSVPVFTKTQIRWMEVSLQNGKLRVCAKIYHNKSHNNQPMASELDRWSFAMRWPRTLFHHSLIEYEKPETPKYRALLYRVNKMSKNDILTLLEGIKGTVGEGQLTKDIEEELEQITTERAKKGSQASQKAQATREAAKKGGNPKKFSEGDIVVTTYPMRFKSGGTYSKFYHVKRQDDKKPHFYLSVDENGYGVGLRYKPTKKYLRRVCPNAFLECKQFTAHEQVQLLQEQLERGRALVNA